MSNQWSESDLRTLSPILSPLEFRKVEMFCSVARIDLQDLIARGLELFLAREILRPLVAEQIEAFEQPCFGRAVYFIQAENGGPIKIGTSTDPYRRLEDFQTGAAEKLRLLGMRPARPRESIIHSLFAVEHVRGEWFEPSRRLLLFIQHFCTRA